MKWSIYWSGIYWSLAFLFKVWKKRGQVPLLAQTEWCKEASVLCEPAWLWARPASHGTASLVSCGEALGARQVELSKLGLLCAYVSLKRAKAFTDLYGRNGTLNFYFPIIFSLLYTALIWVRWKLPKCWCEDDSVFLATCEWQDILPVGSIVVRKTNFLTYTCVA